MPVIQVPVIISKGSKQFLEVTELQISPPSPPVFRIKDIEKEVIITNCKVIKDKVIINGFIDKNINYKTVEDVVDGSVNGPLYHFTTQIPFSTFIDVPGAEEGDNCEVLDAIVEGEKDELLNPNVTEPVTYNTLLEKAVVRIDVKVTRIEEIFVDNSE